MGKNGDSDVCTKSTDFVFATTDDDDDDDDERR